MKKYYVRKKCENLLKMILMRIKFVIATRSCISTHRPHRKYVILKKLII